MNSNESKDKIRQFIYTKVIEEKVVSQVEIANVLGISKSAVSQWFTRGSVPEAYHLLILSDVLKVDVYDILGGKNPYKLSEQDEDNLKFCREYQSNVDSMKNALGWKK